MKVTLGLIQMDVAVGRVRDNQQHMAQLIHEACTKQPDILVLPETWNTGFYTGPELADWADADGQYTQQLIGELSATHRVNIVAGSVATRRHDKVYNTMYVFNRNGKVVSRYDKMHCFTPANEHHFFEAGRDIQHFTLDGIPCSGAICYDVRFPELIRKEVLQGVDLFFLPAQWPDRRLAHWDILVKARAIENQMFVCAVNGCGSIGRVQCAGNSLLIDPWGEEILHLGDSESIQFATIDTDILQDIRSKINVFNDRRPECY